MSLLRKILPLFLLLTTATSYNLPINRPTFLKILSGSTIATQTLLPNFALADEITKLKITLSNSGEKTPLTAILTRSWSPEGYDHFLDLVKSGYYTNAPIFRVIPGFVAQFGLNPDPNITAANSKAIKDDPKGLGPGNKKNTLTFATAGPNTRTTQIFINFGDNYFLDNQGFTPFGVIDDFEVDRIFSGYGEGAPRGKGPDQNKLRVLGEDYMKEFERMTRIEKIEIE